jgi:hypothetical protein
MSSTHSRLDAPRGWSSASRRHPATPVAADRKAVNAERVHQRDHVLRHGPFVGVVAPLARWFSESP